MRPPSLIQSKVGEAAPFIFHLSHFYIQRAALLFPACLCRLPIAGGRDIIRNIYKVNWEFVGLKQHLKPTWKQIALCVLFGLAAVLGVYVETLFLLLPAVFVSLVVYHPITIPMTLLTSIMQSRTNVPINLFEDTLLMVAVFALINESAIRIPGMMGSSGKCPWKKGSL